MLELWYFLNVLHVSEPSDQCLTIYFKVTPNDLLPVSVCSPCLETLTAIHSLVELCVKADEKMRQMLQDVGLGFIQVSKSVHLLPPSLSLCFLTFEIMSGAFFLLCIAKHL